MCLRVLIVLAHGLVVSSACIAQAVIYVDADAMGADNGSSWGDAYATLEAAFVSSVEGDQIWVANSFNHPLWSGNNPLAWSAIRRNVEVFCCFARQETGLLQRAGAEDDRLLALVRQDWTNSGWLNETRTAYLFDESGHRNGHLRQEWSSSNWITLSGNRTLIEVDPDGIKWSERQELEVGNWVAINRSSETLDDLGAVVMTWSQRWEESEWVNIGRKVLERESGLIVKETSQRWDGTAWYDQQIQYSTYNEDGSLTEWYAVAAQTQKKLHRIEYEYEETGLLTRRTEQRDLDGEWANEIQQLRTYDAEGRLTEFVIQKWRGQAWDNDERITTEYDDVVLESQETNYVSERNSAVWIPSYRRTYRNDDLGRTISTSEEDWISGNWQVVRRTTTIHDDENNVVEWFDEGLAEGVWTPSLKHIQTIDYNGFPLELRRQFWNGSAWSNDYRYIWMYEVETAVTSDDLPSADKNLHPNYPNPFGTMTTIPYSVMKAGHVRLTIMDVLGRLIEVLVDEEKSPGRYELGWIADDVSSGIYFYRIEVGRVSSTRRLVVGS